MTIRPYILLVSLLVAGCSLMSPISKDQAGRVAERELQQRDDTAAREEVQRRNIAAREERDQAVMAAPPRAGAGIVGTIDIGKSVEEARKQGAVGQGKGSHVKLDFADASLKDIIVVFMQDYLKQPYTFQDSFKDRKVNLFFDAVATREDLIQLFDTLLDNYGVRLRYAGGVYLIGAGDEKEKGGPALQPSPLGIGDAIGIFRPRFIDGKDLQGLAKQAMKQPDRILVLPGNVVLVNSTSSDARAVASLLRDVDVPAFANKYLIVYAPRYLSATSVVAVLDTYQAQLTGPQAGNKQFEAKQIPENERIVIVAANAIARDLVIQFLNQTDVVGANQRRVFQYSLGTQVAVDLATSVNALLKSVFKSPTELSVVPDKASNSLFIHATPDEYAEIRKLLARMDHRPPAVHIDIIIAEVNLTANMRYGVEYYLKNTGQWLADLTTKLNTNAILTSGLSFGIVSPNDSYATLQLIGSETTFSLLSSPKIVVKNAATAKIAVGREQPVIKQKTVNNAAAGANTIIEPEFKKIGLELEVTPFVTQNNEVRMTIKLKDTSVVGVEILGSDKYPILANREITTDLVTGDGKTIFLGGIRKQDTTDTAEKIPGLGDLQGVGALFRNKELKDNGQELIILATPTILMDQQGADIVTAAIVRAARREFEDPRPAALGAAP